MTNQLIPQKKMPNKMKTLPVLKAIVICLLFSQSTMLQSQSNRLSFVPKIQYDRQLVRKDYLEIYPVIGSSKSISLALYKVVTGDRTDYNIPVKKRWNFHFQRSHWMYQFFTYFLRLLFGINLPDSRRRDKT